jgi:hypothetical protein
MPNKSTLLCFLAVTAATALPAMATATYTYTGNDFQSASGPYTTSDFVSGFFTLASALPDNMAFGTITPVTYSFTDQVQTFTSVSPPPNVTFEVATNATGQIDEWDVSLQNGLNVVSTVSFSSDFGEMPTSEGLVIGSPGSWVQSGGTSAPEPGTMGLISLGLVAVGMARRRLRSRNQAASY